ncbi:MAG: ribosomal S27a family protein [archaeon]
MAKEKKGKKVRKKSTKIKKSIFYKVKDENTVERLGRDCTKCGEGVKMAAHKEKSGKIRYACGNCGLTIWD